MAKIIWEQWLIFYSAIYSYIYPSQMAFLLLLNCNFAHCTVLTEQVWKLYYSFAAKCLEVKLHPDCLALPPIYIAA